MRSYCLSAQVRQRHDAMPMPTSCPRWYVIKSKPRQEYRALENLERQGFPCYLPELSVEKLNYRCKLETREPLFPGYLFIELNDVDDNWYPIRSTRGVSHIVRFNEHPLPIHDAIVETIRERLAGSPLKVPYLQPGDRVRIVDGSFSQLEAIFVANDGEERVMLLLNILHSEQTLSFPVTSVSKSATN
jgi:transcriptional antiterminator RfaH